jgi:hypothetical protein
MRLLAAVSLGFAAALGACGIDSLSGAGGKGSAGNGAGSDGADASVSSSSSDGETARGNPFAQQTDMTEGLVNESRNLDDVLERGALAQACAKFAAGARDRRATLLCGKSMFFDEGFGTVGVPKPLVTFLVQNFPDELGSGFVKVGMIADPRSSEELPLGMVPGKKFGAVDTLSFSCASCHFGRLPDGRYSVGAANHQYAYGLQNLAFMVLPNVALKGDIASHHPNAIAKLQPMIDRLNRDPVLKGKLALALAPLVTGGSAPTVSTEAEGQYASWSSGTMDFFIEPLPFNDHVHTVSKISPLWGIPNPSETASSAMQTAMLGATGGTSSLENFATSFVDLGGGELASWPKERLAPLVEYIYSLRAPKALQRATGDAVARGSVLFRSAGCLDCHSGPRGSGLRLYSYAEIGTDSEMQKWANPKLDGVPEGNLRFPRGDTLTHALKSPRLAGLWAMGRFLHNGALNSLEQLLCESGPRRPITAPALGNHGHTYGCNLQKDDKSALLAFLRTL